MAADIPAHGGQLDSLVQRAPAASGSRIEAQRSIANMFHVWLDNGEHYTTHLRKQVGIICQCLKNSSANVFS